MPSPTEKLQKIFKLETERGYDNRAVVGGLDKIFPNWEEEARSYSIDETTIQAVVQKLSDYRQADTDSRAAILQEILSVLPTASSQAPLQAAKPETAEQPVPEPKRSFRERNNPPIQNSPRQSPNQGRNRRSEYPTGADNQTVVGLSASLTVLPGIGPKHAENLASLGLNTLGDLLYFFPRRYDDYSKLKPINRLEYGDELTIIATVQSSVSRPLRGGQAQMTEVIVSDGTGFLRVNWFNQPWLSNRLKSGDQVVLSGKVDMYLGRLVMNSPDWEDLDQEHLHTNRIVPVYPLTAKITQRWLRRLMFQTVGYWASKLTEFLPADVRESANLVSLPVAIKQAHFPDSSANLEAAQFRLAFDEIFLIQMGVLSQKKTWQAQTAQVFSVEDSWFDALAEKLPYSLTSAQHRAIQDIRADLCAGRPMNRLLQGDVGSGKTIVAAIAAAIVLQNGAQAAVMAPTSILAEQHYRSLSKLMVHEEDQEQPQWDLLQQGEIRLLIGSTPEQEKAEIRSGLEDGSIRLVVGTHALIEDPITFKRLQLAIVDEQHRFGVAQRSLLRAKGENPHLLVMTATPIPRSLALTVYGDLDLCVMDEMPAGRIPIKTVVLSPVFRERAYNLIRSQVKEGHQAFIIYPLVEQGEREDDRAAVEEQERLQREVFHNLKVGLLHGRMKPDEKDTVMTAFRDREYDVLVSTSVIEVGVDVPNSTVMVIEGANRFGLAQLHQFRGRVGRGSAESYCLLIPDREDRVENERLAVMAETNDGFVLAEKDLEQRGPGDFLGNRQSGFMELRMAKLTDVRLIEKARTQAQAVFQKDPALTLPEHAELDRVLNRFWSSGRGDIS
jgi:ATP-dependent DNA helicase RecG